MCCLCPINYVLTCGQAQSLSRAQKTLVRSKTVNVSHLRRENELHRVIEECGGMVNILTKEFYDAHMNLIEALNRAGEPTSSPPGIRLDRRTAESTLNAMASRERIKIIKTSLFTSTGASRPATIIYLPEVEQDMLNSFLLDLGRNYAAPVTHYPSVKKIEEPLNYSSVGSAQRSALPLQLLQMEERGGDEKERWSRNTARAEQLFGFDDAIIREVLLAEKATLAQMYGFIVGKAMRARSFHLATLDFFEKHILSPRIVSFDNRIVELSLFYHDFALSSFCAVIGAITHDEAVDEFLQTPEGQATPVEKIPIALHTSLQVGRARTRTRFLDLLEFLRSLDLVVPLRPSDSSSARFSCVPNGKHPTAFDVASLEGWSTTASINAPRYWRFNDSAPIHIWSQSEISPPFWKDMAAGTVVEAVSFWSSLERACRDSKLPLSITGPSTGDPIRPSNASFGVARSLRRQVSWNGGYVLTWHQEQYLQRFVDRDTGETPAQDNETGGGQLQNICWVVSAPREAVERYFETAGKKMARDLEKARQKHKRQVAEDDARKASEAKALLQKKAAEAKLQREKDWDDMLLRVHPGDLKTSAATRMRRVRGRFLQSTGSNVEKWEGEIAQAIRDIKIAAKESNPKRKNISSMPLAPSPPCIPPLPAVVAQSEKSVQRLISQQGTPYPKQPPTARSKGKGKAKAKPAEGTFLCIRMIPSLTLISILDNDQLKPLARRGRFQWNGDYDELARDASVVIRARCRDGARRLEWSALEQVFPSVPRNSVRQRIVALREIPSAEAYLKRLEDRWYSIWTQHRGTVNLPDDDPQSLSNFDLVKHVEFLRKYIDKNAMWVSRSLCYMGINT